jgi:GNAT superfamily N-acetyltransferase
MSIIIKKFKYFKTCYLYDNNFKIGQISYTKKNNVTYLNNLFINKEFRNKGHSQKLLNHVYLLNKNNIIKLNVWEPLDNPKLVSYYKKRGYIISNNDKTIYYDDGERIFEIIEMTKYININK